MAAHSNAKRSVAATDSDGSPSKKVKVSNDKSPSKQNVVLMHTKPCPAEWATSESKKLVGFYQKQWYRNTGAKRSEIWKSGGLISGDEPDTFTWVCFTCGDYVVY